MGKHRSRPGIKQINQMLSEKKPRREIRNLLDLYNDSSFLGVNDFEFLSAWLIHTGARSIWGLDSPRSTIDEDEFGYGLGIEQEKVLLNSG